MQIIRHYLALDVDGVLSPGLSGTFIYNGRLEGFMRQHPSVHVVFSTSWRLHHPWQALASLFAPDLRTRFVGATPEFDENQPAAREKEILAWYRGNAEPGAALAALDDDATLFSPGCPWLVLCETHRGLRNHHLDELAVKLGLAAQK